VKRSRAQHDEIEEAILEAADRLLARGGYQQLTMDELAQEAGLAKGALYLHFQSKADVILAQIDRISAQVLAGLERIAASSAPPADKIRQMILLRVMHRFDSVQHYPESVAEVIHDVGPMLLQQREKHFAAEARIVAEVLKDAEPVMTVSPDERNAVANAVIAATNALLPYNLTALEFGRRREIAEKADRIATMLLRGLLRPGDRGPKRRAA
jgi:AcrR family transcriptional regulator